jgi:hypothetical protein
MANYFTVRRLFDNRLFPELIRHGDETNGRKELFGFLEHSYGSVSLALHFVRDVNGWLVRVRDDYFHDIIPRLAPHIAWIDEQGGIIAFGIPVSW